jgi:rubrerythrin
MRKILACCEEIEQTVAEIYKYWQKVYSDDQGFSELWKVLADDELAHVNQIKLARRIQDDGLFNNVDVKGQELDALRLRAKKLLADVQKVTLSKEKALRTAIKIEESFNKAHVENAGEFADPSIRAMFTSLAREEAEHMATLQNYYDRNFGVS